MRKVFIFILSVLMLSILGHFSFPKAYAAITVEQNPNPVCQDSKEYTLTFKSDKSDFVPNQDYTLGIWKTKGDSNDLDPGTTFNYIYKSNNDGKILTSVKSAKTITILNQRAKVGLWHYKLWFGAGTNVLKKEPDRLIASGELVMFPKEACTLGLPILEMSSPVQISDTVTIKVKNINPDSEYLLWFIDGQVFNDGKFPANTIVDDSFIDKAGVKKSVKTAGLSPILENKIGTKTLCLKHGSINFFGFGKNNCEISIPIEVTVQKPQVTPTIIQSSQPGASLQDSALFSEPNKSSNLPDVPPPCAEFKDKKCIAVDTAIGRISTEPQGFVKRIFSFVLGIAGGIALILIIISGYRMMASQGNPEALTAARDQLISAIVGLLFIIFSFVILQVIGVDILRIPGFGE